MVKSVRLQLKRTKGFNLQKLSKKTNNLEAIVVSRPSKWGNPWEMKKPLLKGFPISGRQFAIYAYKRYIKDFGLKNLVKKELKGKNLACWCKLSEKCHADILLNIAND